MKILVSSFLIFLGCAFAQSTTHPPNGCPDRLTYSYTTGGTWPEEYSNTQYALNNPEHPQVIPAAGIHVVMRIDNIPTTGWHGHNGPNRPNPGIVEVFPAEPGAPLTGNTGYGVTGPDGKVTFTWRGPKYSGWYVVNVLPQSQDPCNTGCKLTNPDLSNYCYNIYLTETDHSTNTHQGKFFDVAGSPQVLNDYGSGDPFPDSRHTGHSRYITFATLAKLGTMSLEFRTATGSNLDILRAGLPSGGHADNQVFPIPFGAYLLNEWLTQYSEDHFSGNEVDFINPAVNNPGKWGQFVNAVNHSTCVFGRLDPVGNPLGPSFLNYWSSQPLVHVVCDPSIEPPPLQPIGQ